jgi:hypothetical protein
MLNLRDGRSSLKRFETRACMPIPRGPPSSFMQLFNATCCYPPFSMSRGGRIAHQKRSSDTAELHFDAPAAPGRLDVARRVAYCSASSFATAVVLTARAAIASSMPFLAKSKLSALDSSRQRVDLERQLFDVCPLVLGLGFSRGHYVENRAGIPNRSLCRPTVGLFTCIRAAGGICPSPVRLRYQ